MNKKLKEKINFDTERLTFTTSRSYWREIACNLEEWVEVLEDQVGKINEILPDSTSYWTMNSRLSDAKSVAKVVREFLDERSL